MRATCVGIVVAVLPDPGAPARAADYAIGADLSFLKQAEDPNKAFKDEGKARPALRIFKDHGYNWVRLRLFHSPKSLPNNLDYLRQDVVDSDGADLNPGDDNRDILPGVEVHA